MGNMLASMNPAHESCQMNRAELADYHDSVYAAMGISVDTMTDDELCALMHAVAREMCTRLQTKNTIGEHTSEPLN
jgi:hypothetical protein